MNEEMQGIKAVLARLEEVERQSRRLQFSGIGILALCGVCLMMGQATPKPRSIEVEEFRLLDKEGRTRVEMSSSADGGLLVNMTDRLGMNRFLLR